MVFVTTQLVVKKEIQTEYQVASKIPAERVEIHHKN